MILESKLKNMLCSKRHALQGLNSIIRCLTSSDSSSTNYFKSTLHLEKYSQKLSEKETTRKFSTNSILHNFFIAETYAAVDYLQTCGKFSNSISIKFLPREELPFDSIDGLLEKQWISMSNSEFVENFELLSHYAAKVQDTLDDPKYQGILEVLTNKVEDFSDTDIRHLLNCLSLWNPLKTNEAFKALWTTIENECLKRFRNWTIDEVLMTNDLFYKLRVARQSEFCWQSLRRLGFKPQQMNCQQLIHFAFMMKVTRRLPMRVYNIEYHLEQFIDEFTIEDFGIIAMAFSKYETPFRSTNFTTKFLDKLLEHVETVNEIYLVDILANVRINETMYEKLEILLEKLEKRLPTFSLYCLSRIANFQRKIIYVRDSLMIKIIERFEREIKEARLKEAELVVYSLFTFTYDPEKVSFYSILEEECVKFRAEEIDKFPKSFLTTVRDMLQANYFCKDAAKIVLDPEFINKICSNDRWRLERDLLLIDFCLEIDHPEYDGLRLDGRLRDYLIKRFGSLRRERQKQFTDTKSKDEEFLINVSDICKKVMGSESLVHIDYALPYCIKNFVFLCYDPEKKTFESPVEKLSAMPVEMLKYAPNDGRIWYALAIGSVVSMIKNTKRPNGGMSMHLRHLEKIGYTPILVPYYEWGNRDESEKQKYLSDLLRR